MQRFIAKIFIVIVFMGYPKAQFVANPVLSAYSCLICKDIVKTLLTFICCDSLLCGDCGFNAQCPKGCVNVSFPYAKPLSGSSKMVYELLVIKCSHSPACKWKDSLTKLDHHLSECDVHPRPCPYTFFRCKYIGQKSDLDTHLKKKVVPHLKGVLSEIKDLNSLNEGDQLNSNSEEESEEESFGEEESFDEEESESLLVSSLKKESIKLRSSLKDLIGKKSVF
eukprot:TRINITY_DN2859_c2_g1_i1.p1 TRINITY_DN2859_c2_g1~~TRINITY_DN2859_c2_g1_i1.p1  ORF type:complete len:223 (+),score=36.14 TRINITY_DN2859_c2_g1_i1:92-760(+)